jgi:PAS domain-containing protein
MAEKLTYEQLEKKLRDLEAKTAVLENSVQSLRESEERFRTIYANAPVMIDAFDETGRGMLWNKECEKMLGWREEEILSSDDPLSLLYPDHNLRDRVLSDKMQTVYSASILLPAKTPQNIFSCGQTSGCPPRR